MRVVLQTRVFYSAIKYINISVISDVVVVFGRSPFGKSRVLRETQFVPRHSCRSVANTIFPTRLTSSTGSLHFSMRTQRTKTLVSLEQAVCGKLHRNFESWHPLELPISREINIPIYKNRVLLKSTYTCYYLHIHVYSHAHLFTYFSVFNIHFEFIITL